MALEELDGIRPSRSAARRCPIMQLRRSSTLLGMPPARSRTAAPTTELATRSSTARPRAAATRPTQRCAPCVQTALELWGEPLFDLEDERPARLEHLRSVLERPQGPRTRSGKLNRLNLDDATIGEAAGRARRARRIERRAGGSRQALRRRRVPARGDGRVRRRSRLSQGRARPAATEIIDLLDGETRSTPHASSRRCATPARSCGTRFADAASRVVPRTTDSTPPATTRKRQLLDGRRSTILDTLSGGLAARPGPFASSAERAASTIATCFEIDETDTRELGHLPGSCGYRPEPIDGPSASARLEGCERRGQRLVDEWTDTPRRQPAAIRRWPSRSATSATRTRRRSRRSATTAQLPDPIDDAFVAALNQVFDRFDIRNVDAGRAHGTPCSPTTSPATVERAPRAGSTALLDSSRRAAERRTGALRARAETEGLVTELRRPTLGGRCEDVDAAARGSLAERLPELRDAPRVPDRQRRRDILAMSLPPYYTACPNPIWQSGSRRPSRTGRRPRLRRSRPVRHRHLRGQVATRSTRPTPTRPRCRTRRSCGSSSTTPSPAMWSSTGSAARDDRRRGAGVRDAAATTCGARSKRRWATVRWGARRAVLQDLSPSATFIAAGVNLPVDAEAFDRRSAEILDQFDAEWGWMYKTTDERGRERTHRLHRVVGGLHLPALRRRGRLLRRRVQRRDRQGERRLPLPVLRQGAQQGPRRAARSRRSARSLAMRSSGSSCARSRSMAIGRRSGV